MGGASSAYPPGHGQILHAADSLSMALHAWQLSISINELSSQACSHDK